MTESKTLAVLGAGTCWPCWPPPRWPRACWRGVRYGTCWPAARPRTC
jgi:hypothetical protein